MDIPQVLKHLVGWSHVLIQIIEISQEQLPPTIEMIQRLIHLCRFGKTLVQLTYQQDRVSHLPFRVTAEQVADGDIGRTP